jgi:hypothetical protein
MNRDLRVLPVAMLVAVVLAAPSAQANQLQVETAGIQRNAEAKTVRVNARVSWKNGWRNSRNYDAVWLVVKLRGNSRTPWTHGRLVRASTQGTPQGSCNVSKDLVGAFCLPTADHRGDVAWQVSLEVEPVGLREADVVAGPRGAAALRFVGRRASRRRVRFPGGTDG